MYIHYDRLLLAPRGGPGPPASGRGQDSGQTGHVKTWLE